MDRKPTINDNNGNPVVLLERLRRLSETLASLVAVPSSHSSSSSTSAASCPLTHYRRMPPALVQSYQLLEQGSQLVHATSTKYTLMGKIIAKNKSESKDTEEDTGNQMATDLLQGCSLIATAAVVIVQHAGPSARRYCLQASRSVISATIQLVESFTTAATTETASETDAAVKTGVVWEACDRILQKRVPQGNRNSLRRDLLVFLQECQETMDEFQQMIESSRAAAAAIPAASSSGGSPESVIENGETEADTNEINKGAQEEAEDVEDDWEAFLDGQMDQYTQHELPIAVTCVGLIKCSRGTINLVLQACEALGKQLDEDEPNGGDNRDENFVLSNLDQERLRWMFQLHELARVVGQGMTDLGATLYPPLHDLQAILEQVERQTNAIQSVLDHLETTPYKQTELGSTVTELHAKLLTAVRKRRQEALEAIATTEEHVVVGDVDAVP